MESQIKSCSCCLTIMTAGVVSLLIIGYGIYRRLWQPYHQLITIPHLLAPILVIAIIGLINSLRDTRPTRL